MNQLGKRRLSVLLAAAFGAVIVLSGAAMEKRSPAVKTDQESGSRTSPPAAGGLSIISSSHQDIAWMDSPEKCVEFRDRNVISPALAMLGKNGAYAFDVENMLNLMEYLERHPDRRDEIARYTREGRMEWGATFNSTTNPSSAASSSSARSISAGAGSRKFPGCDARVAFSPDVPGRSMQMPRSWPRRACRMSS